MLCQIQTRDQPQSQCSPKMERTHSVSLVTNVDNYGKDGHVCEFCAPNTDPCYVVAKVSANSFKIDCEKTEYATNLCNLKPDYHNLKDNTVKILNGCRVNIKIGIEDGYLKETCITCDTGATISCLSRALLRELFPEKSIKINTEQMILKSANGSLIPIDGTLKMYVLIGTVMEKIKFAILRDGYTFLLSHPDLKRFQAILNLINKTLTVGQRNINKELVKKSEDDNSHWSSPHYVVGQVFDQMSTFQQFFTQPSVSRKNNFVVCTVVEKPEWTTDRMMTIILRPALNSNNSHLMYHDLDIYNCNCYLQKYCIQCSECKQNGPIGNINLYTTGYICFKIDRNNLKGIIYPEFVARKPEQECEEASQAGVRQGSTYTTPRDSHDQTKIEKLQNCQKHQVKTISSDDLFFHQDVMRITPPAYVYENNKLLLEASSLTVKKSKHKIQDQVTIQELEQALNCQYCSIRYPQLVYCNVKDTNCITRQKLHEQIYGKLSTGKCKIISPTDELDSSQEKHLFLMIKVDRLEDYKSIAYLKYYRDQIDEFVRSFQESEQQMQLYHVKSFDDKYYFFICLYQRNCTLILTEIFYEIENILRKYKGRQRLALLNHKELSISQHRLSIIFHSSEVDIILLNVIQHQVLYVDPSLNVKAQEQQTQSIQETVDRAETDAKTKQGLTKLLTGLEVKEEGKESLFSTHTNEINHFHSDSYPFSTFIIHLPIKDQYKDYIPPVPKEKYIAADLREQAKEMLQGMVEAQILTPRHTAFVSQSVWVSRKLPISKEEWIGLGRSEKDWFPNTSHPAKVSLRLTQNFQDINKKFQVITYNQETPLEQLRNLSNNVRVISIIDVTAAYHTIVLSKETTDLLGFFSGIPDFYDILVYNRLAMGLTPSKAVLDLCLEYTFRPKPDITMTDQPTTLVPMEVNECQGTKNQVDKNDVKFDPEYQGSSQWQFSSKQSATDGPDTVKCDEQNQSQPDKLIFKSGQRMPRKCIKRWSDNILVVSDNDNEHLDDLGFVLNRLRDHGWKLKLKKFSPFQKGLIEIYGYILDIQQGTLRPASDKLKSLRETPFPDTLTKLRSFLGSLNFVANFLPLVDDSLQKLHSLCKKSAFAWDESTKRAYDNIMHLLSMEKLIYNKRANYDLAIWSCCDSSKEKSAHVIYQIDEQQNPHILVYGHNVFPVQHQTFGPTLNEVFSMMHCIKDLETYQYCPTPCHIITDAKVLCLLVLGGSTNTRMLRIKMYIQNLTWLIPLFQRNTTSEIILADYFSRNFGQGQKKYTQKLPGEMEEQMADVIGKKIDPAMKIPMHAAMTVIDYLLDMPYQQLDTIMDESVKFENGKILFEINDNIVPEKEKDRTTLQSIIEHQMTLQKKTKSKKKSDKSNKPEAIPEEDPLRGQESLESVCQVNSSISIRSVFQVLTRSQAKHQREKDDIPILQDDNADYTENVFQFLNPRSNIPSRMVVEEKPNMPIEKLTAFQKFHRHLVYNTPHLDLKGFRAAQRVEPRFSEIIKSCEQSNDGVYGDTKNKKLYFLVDELLFCSEYFANTVIYKLCAPAHCLYDSIVIGHRQQHHSSAQQLCNQLLKIFETPNLLKLCQTVVQQCHVCTCARPNYGGTSRRDLPKAPTLLSEPRICVSIDELAIPAGESVVKCLLAIDVFSNFMYIEFLDASLTSNIFESFIRRIKMMYGNTLQYIITDNDIRLENAKISRMCEEIGIFKISTLQYSPKSLLAELGNRLLLDVVRLELVAGNAPVEMFKSIIEAAVVSLNESPFYDSPSISPHSLFYGCHAPARENISFIENNDILDKEKYFQLTLYLNNTFRQIRSAYNKRRQRKLKEAENRNKRDDYQDKIVPGSVVVLRNRDQLRGGIYKTLPHYHGKMLVIKRTASSVLMVPLSSNAVDEYVDQIEPTEKTETKLAIKADISQLKLLNASVFIQDDKEFYPQWAIKRRSPRPLYINQHSGGYNLDDWNTHHGHEELSTFETFCVIRKQVYQVLSQQKCLRKPVLKSILKYRCAGHDFYSEQLNDVVQAASRVYRPRTDKTVCFNAQTDVIEFPFMEDIYWGNTE